MDVPLQKKHRRELAFLATRRQAKFDYTAQDKQRQLHESPANEILFGGAAGPGKSRALRAEAFIYCSMIPHLQAYLFRRTYPELEDNHIINALMEYPPEIARYNEQKKRFHFHNGSMLHMCHCQHEKNVFIYQGAEIHLLLIDELTTFTQFIYDYLFQRVRCTLPHIPDAVRHKIPGVITASNPGGVGHEWVKARWVNYAQPYELKRAPKDPEHPEHMPMLRQFIPGLLEDNPILMERDPGYITRLNNLPEPWRTAYMKGDWDIFMGQAFMFSKRHHVIKPMPIPEGAPIYWTMDWGFGAPFSIGWWWIDADGRFYRFSELYGQMPGAEPNTGVRWTDETIAQKIIEHEVKHGLRDKNGVQQRDIHRIGSPDCWSKKPDYKGGGQGPSTAETFESKGISMRPGDPTRILKIRQFHERLRIPTNPDGSEGMPMMLVYDTCEDFIRTIPTLQTDEKNREDIDTDSEDHAYDEAALLCMARPMHMDLVAIQKEVEAKEKAAARSKLDHSAQSAWKEVDELEKKHSETPSESDWRPL